MVNVILEGQTPPDVATQKWVQDEAKAHAAGTADKLSQVRTFPAVNLGTSASATFDGSKNPTALGVTGTLPIANGGTGATNASAALAALGGVPTSRKVNGTALTGDITLSAGDVGALPTTGGTMSGAIAMGNQKITGLGTPTATADAATKGYVDSNTVPNTRKVNGKALSSDITITASEVSALPLSGGTMTGVINMGNHKITNVTTPTDAGDAVNKGYVDQQINDMAEYAGWGDQTAVGDQAWWAALKSWVLTAFKKELETCLGKKKKVQLSSSVLGLSSGAQVSMVCVGYNCDGPGNSLTFQTEGITPTETAFGSSAVWSSSCTAQNYCTNFGNYCSASQSLKSVSQQYCGATPDGNRGKSHTTYYSLECFIPSECQMGWTSSGTASNSNGYAISQDEWTEGGQHIPYQWYTSNSRRKKYRMNSDGSLGKTASYYWERSRYYNSSSSSGACRVFSDGGAFWDRYNAGHGLAPAFVIG